MAQEKPIFPSTFFLGQDEQTRALGLGDPNEYGLAQMRKINIIEGNISQRMSRSTGFLNRYLYREGSDGYAILESMPNCSTQQFVIDIMDRYMEADLPVISQGIITTVKPWSTAEDLGNKEVWYSIETELDDAVDKLSDIWKVSHTMLTGSGQKIECNLEEYRRCLTALRGRISEYFDHRLKFEKVAYKIIVLDHGGKTTTYQPVIIWQTGRNNSTITLTADYPQIPERYKQQQRSAELDFKIAQWLCWLLKEVNDQNTGKPLVDGVTRDRLSIMAAELRLSTDEMIESLVYRLLHQMQLPISERLYSKLNIFVMCIQELFKVYSDVRDPNMKIRFNIDVKLHDLPLLRDTEFANSYFNPAFHKAHAGTTKVNFLPIGNRATNVSPVFSFLELDYNLEGRKPATMSQDFTAVEPTIGVPTQAFGSELCIPRDRVPDIFYPVSGEFTGLEAEAMRQGLLDNQESKKTLIINRDHPYPMYPITLDGFTNAFIASNVSILDGPAQYPIRIWHKNRLTDEWF